MASIQKRKKFDGNYSYTVRIRIKNTPSLTITFDSFEEALEWVDNNEDRFREDPLKYFEWLDKRRANANKYPLNPFEEEE